ncbi:MAG: ribosomal protein S18-alanine N-acetyltransferase [Nitrososphaerales archaeon]
MHDDLEIRSFEKNDLEAIVQIERASFDDPYPRSLFLRLHKERYIRFTVALLTDAIVGYCIVATKGESSHIVSLAIRPNYRLNGIASRLIADAISSIKREFPQARQIGLEVGEDNLGAIALYSKYGFKKITKIRDYYGSKKDAFVMKLDLDE